ncbi:MAG: hypothetical protein KDC38_19660 [Planctomycetes bacterium]|nr:hypothetical protein [Planctomycetota bacterium]
MSDLGHGTEDLVRCAREPEVLLVRDASPRAAEDLAAHLEQCSVCRGRLRELSAFEDRLTAALRRGDRCDEVTDRRLRTRFRVAVRDHEGALRSARRERRPMAWGSVLATAALLVFAVVPMFLHPRVVAPRGSIYGSERDGEGRLAPGVSYGLLIESAESAAVYVIHVAADGADIIVPYALGDGSFDDLGYGDAVLAAGETRIVPHPDSGVKFRIDSPSGTVETFFFASTPQLLPPEALESLRRSVVGAGTEVEKVRSIVESRFVAVSQLRIPVR